MQTLPEHWILVFFSPISDQTVCVCPFFLPALEPEGNPQGPPSICFCHWLIHPQCKAVPVSSKTTPCLPLVLFCSPVYFYSWIMQTCLSIWCNVTSPGSFTVISSICNHFDRIQLQRWHILTNSLSTQFEGLLRLMCLSDVQWTVMEN